jgi:hypothetical protein
MEMETMKKDDDSGGVGVLVDVERGKEARSSCWLLGNTKM